MNRLESKDCIQHLRHLTKISSALAAIVLLAVGCSARQTAPQTEADKPALAKKPNIVVVLADDLRFDALELTGNPVMKTPNINALAERGTFFKNAFVTTSVCTPSRASIMTGQYERKHGVTFQSFTAMTENAYSKTYPMVLKDDGYFVGWVGKNHIPAGKVNDEIGYYSGFVESQYDYWYGNQRHTYFYPKERHKIYRKATHDTQVEILNEAAMHFLKGDDTFAQRHDFLPERPKDQPFALMINYNVPHAQGTNNMEQRPSDRELYLTTYRDEADKFKLPDTFVAYEDIQTPKHPKDVYENDYIKSYSYAKKPETLREKQIREAQTVTGIDDMLGNIVAALEEQGVADNTIIVFFSDHGIQHGEHGLGGKVLLYDESVHVPMIVYDPRVPSGKRQSIVDDFALSVDIAPTILDLAGITPPDTMQGSSVKPFLTGKPSNWRDDIFMESMMITQGYPLMEAVRNDDFKYIRYFDKNKQYPLHADALAASIKGEKPVYEELFDLRTDPNETTNLAEQPEYASTLKNMRKRALELVKEAKGEDDPDVHLYPGDRYSTKSNPNMRSTKKKTKTN